MWWLAKGLRHGHKGLGLDLQNLWGKLELQSQHGQGEGQEDLWSSLG